MNNKIKTFLLTAAGIAATAAMIAPAPAAPPSTDKTLVSWVTITDPTLRAGSILTLQRGSEFDGIVFAEKEPVKWMVGSDFWKRTQDSQNSSPSEAGDGKALLQMAIVYKDDTITIYRNGESYASYKAENIDLLSGANFVVFGLRHVGGNGSIGGSIEDARIYAKALSVAELKALEPNKKSSIEPYAWWDFEGSKAVDRMNRFPEVRISGEAKFANGKLMLGADASLVASRPFVPEQPSWPSSPPANWLTFHLAHPGPGDAVPGDPNCAFYWKEQYHLHYIYRNQTGFVFAHVSSTDMVHWKWHSTTLTPRTTGHGMFSGTGFFTKEGKPAIIYHGEGSGHNWIQYPLDDQFDSWSKPEPVLSKTADGRVADFRQWDPDCWTNGGTCYALSGGQNPQLMKSTNLHDWLYLGDVFHSDFPTNLGVPKNTDVSCANMFQIGNKWMLLCIAHPLGCRYYLGDFKDEKFLPDFHAMMSWNGNNFFAPESVLTQDGRRVMWAWLMNLPIEPTGVQSLPRELELPADGVLRIRPLRELAQLRYDKTQESDITVKGDTAYLLARVAGDALELELKCKAPLPKEFGMDVLCDAKGGKGLRIAVNAEARQLRVGGVNAPFVMKPGEDLTLRVFLDKNLVEVFANDRQAAVTAARADSPPQNTHAKLFAAGGDLKAETVTAWKMKSIYQVNSGKR